VAGAIAPAVLAGIGCDVHELYCDVDGEFPNHHPDPSDPHNLQDLILSVKQTGADIGLAFDGDGDRLGVVTRTGEVIYPDRLLMLFAADVLSRNPGATIIYDVKCTGHLQPLILQHGGSPIMWRTGHSLIKAKMRETGAQLAGEMSGHFFFAERWYGFDDAVYAAARLLEIVAGDPEGRSPEEIFASLPKGVSTPELKIELHEGEHYRVIEAFKRADFEGARLTTIRQSATGLTVGDWSAHRIRHRCWSCASMRKTRSRSSASRPYSANSCRRSIARLRCRSDGFVGAATPRCRTRAASVMFREIRSAISAACTCRSGLDSAQVHRRSEAVVSSAVCRPTACWASILVRTSLTWLTRRGPACRCSQFGGTPEKVGQILEAPEPGIALTCKSIISTVAADCLETFGRIGRQRPLVVAFLSFGGIVVYAAASPSLPRVLGRLGRFHAFDQGIECISHGRPYRTGGCCVMVVAFGVAPFVADATRSDDRSGSARRQGCDQTECRFAHGNDS
jgi:hypothetical protein